MWFNGILDIGRGVILAILFLLGHFFGTPLKTPILNSLENIEMNDSIEQVREVVKKIDETRGGAEDLPILILNNTQNDELLALIAEGDIAGGHLGKEIFETKSGMEAVAQKVQSYKEKKIFPVIESEAWVVRYLKETDIIYFDARNLVSVTVRYKHIN